MEKRISQIKEFNKIITVPSDKSITHRAIMLAGLASGTTNIINPLMSEDCLQTLECITRLGAKTRRSTKNINGFIETVITVDGVRNGFKSCDLNAGNSGTTVRLMSGMLASQEGKHFTFDGDESLRKRPMRRIIEPLTKMNADISGEKDLLPLDIKGKKLSGITYEMPVASAQVKSAILLAGLNADGETTVIEKIKSRDHTERILKAFGADITEKGSSITVKRSKLKGVNIKVSGDISSAAFPLVLAAAKENSSVTVLNVGLNPSRMGIINVLQSCGADLIILNQRTECFEPVGDIVLNYKKLKPFYIKEEQVPSLIDEIPILAVLACFIEGKSVITGAKELKVKESNRIDTVVKNLGNLGADITATDDGMIIYGRGSLVGGGEIYPKGDHRIAMSMAVAGCLSTLGTTVYDSECAAVSYPDFYEEVLGIK